jgi:hypothetical protein
MPRLLSELSRQAVGDLDAVADTTLLAPVPHRHVALTIPKRPRAYGLCRRRLLGEIARAVARASTLARQGTAACTQATRIEFPIPKVPSREFPIPSSPSARRRSEERTLFDAAS